MRKLDMNKIESRIIRQVSTEKALKDVNPFQYSKEVLEGKKKIVLTADKECVK